MTLLPKLGCALAAIALAVAPAPATAEDGSPAATQGLTGKERFVPLEGGRNFRDLGGYRTGDGRSVKWGLIYRSGSMHGLTGGDFETLKTLGVRSIIDFRSSEERVREPFNAPAGHSLAVYAKDYVLTMSELGQSLSSPDANAEQTRVAFERFYGRIPFQFAEHYREMFAHLLDNRAPLIVNCSAGKDRTGVAVALILTALGVPRETIVEDYLLSNARFKPDLNDPRLSRMRPDVAAVLYSVDARYLHAAFRALESGPGGIDAFFQTELGVDSAGLERLRALYLD